MALIEKEVLGDQGITVFRVNGKVDLDEVIGEISAFYKGDFTNHTMWDLTDADVTDLTREEIEKIVSHAKDFGHLRDNGKTAFIMPSALKYGLGRMYDSMAQVLSHPITHGVFKVYDDAVDWVNKIEQKEIQDI